MFPEAFGVPGKDQTAFYHSIYLSCSNPCAYQKKKTVIEES